MRGGRAGRRIRMRTGCSRAPVSGCGVRRRLSRFDHRQGVAGGMVRRLGGGQRRGHRSGDLSGRIEDYLLRPRPCRVDADGGPIDPRAGRTLAERPQAAIQTKQQRQYDAARKHEISNDQHQRHRAMEQLEMHGEPLLHGSPRGGLSPPPERPCGCRDRPASRGCPNRRSDIW